MRVTHTGNKLQKLEKKLSVDFLDMQMELPTYVTSFFATDCLPLLESEPICVGGVVTGESASSVAVWSTVSSCWSEDQPTPHNRLLPAEKKQPRNKIREKLLRRCTSVCFLG